MTTTTDPFILPCVKCGREVDARKESWHYPSENGCDAGLRRLRKSHPERPTCLECLPAIFKRPFLDGSRPILGPADLPKAGDPIPAHVVRVEDPRPRGLDERQQHQSIVDALYVLHVSYRAPAPIDATSWLADGLVALYERDYGPEAGWPASCRALLDHMRAVEASARGRA